LYKNHTYKILDLRYKRKCAVYPCDRNSCNDTKSWIYRHLMVGFWRI